METPPTTTILPFPQPQKNRRFSVFIIVFLLVVGLVAGGLIGYAVTYSDFNGKLNSIRAQLHPTFLYHFVLSLLRNSQI